MEAVNRWSPPAETVAPEAPKSAPGLFAAPEPTGVSASGAPGGQAMLDGTAIANLVPLGVLWVASFLVLLIPSLLLSLAGVPWWLPILAWTAGGFAAFHPKVEVALARLLFKVRPPTGAEKAKLEPAWHNVCTRAGIDPGGDRPGRLQPVGGGLPRTERLRGVRPQRQRDAHGSGLPAAPVRGAARP